MIIERVPTITTTRPAGKAFIANKNASFFAGQQAMDTNKPEAADVLEIDLAEGELEDDDIPKAATNEVPMASDDDGIPAKWVSAASHEQTATAI